MLASFGIASASGIHISPLQVSFVGADRAEQMRLRNDSANPVVMQARIFGWRQDLHQGMLLESTDAIAASPPMMTIAPGATQIVRIIRRQNLPDDREHYFRLLLDELPGAAESGRSAVKMLTRYSVPVFVETVLSAQPALQVSWQRCATGQQWLEVVNRGGRRARLGSWQLTAGNQSLGEHRGLAGYALAGQRIALPLEFDTQPANAFWQVQTDSGEFSAPVVAVKRAPMCLGRP